MNSSSCSTFTSKLSHNRSFLMGCAMIGIILFHAPHNYLGVASGLFFSIFGRWGVEIFLFLSGFGVYHSLVRNRDVKSFYKRRIIRIFPAALVAGWMTFLVTPDNLLAILGLNLWYIQTILIFYLFSPLFMRVMNTRNPLLFILLICLACHAFVFACYEIISPHIPFITHSSITWTLVRLPAYLMGMYVASLGLNDTTENKKTLKSLLTTGILSLIVAVFLRLGYDFSLYTNTCLLRSIYLFLGLSMPLVCSTLYTIKSILPSCFHIPATWMGVLSLEIYVIHELLYCFLTQELSIHPRITITLAILISFIFAYFFHGLSLRMQKLLLHSN